VRSAESKEHDAEVEHLLGSGRLPKGPCCHLRGFVSGLDSVKKERAAASTFKRRAPHRSSCSRHAQQRRRPSTEIRLEITSLKTHRPLLAFFVPQTRWCSGRDPPKTPWLRRCTPHSYLTRGAFSDKGLSRSGPRDSTTTRGSSPRYLSTMTTSPFTLSAGAKTAA
jgi:hypothetical protein